MALTPELSRVIGDRPVELNLSARAKRLSLSVSRIDGRVRVTAPRRARQVDVLRLLEEHRDWLREVVAQAPQMVLFRHGARFPLAGREVVIAESAQRRATLSADGGRLMVAGGPDLVGHRVEAYLKEAARARLREASLHYAKTLGREVAQISIRDTRSRWGSCSSRGALSYSWRLIMAPPAVLDYVAAHEASHLVLMDHSPNFWRVVESLRPTWRSERAWLRQYGAELHRYRAVAA